MLLYLAMLLAAPYASAGAPAMLAAITNVRDHGVKGDGVADDTDALQAVFDTATKGSTIFLPAGTYAIKATLQLPSNVTICGAGADATTLRAVGPLQRMLHGEGVVNLCLRDLSLLGCERDSGKEDDGGLTITPPKRAGKWPLHLTLERVQVAKFHGSGIVALGGGNTVGTGVTVRDCTVHDVGRHAILAYLCRRILIEHCDLHHLGGSGTIFPRVTDVTVRNCSVRDTGLEQWGHGIEVGDESSGFLIENNVVENSGDHAGVLIEQGASRGVIAHNRILRPRFQGIQLNNKPAKAAVSEVRVVGNLVDMGENREHSAMLVYGDTSFLADDCIIEGNTLIGGKVGLEMHYVRRSVIARNIVRETASAGMELIHHRSVTISDNHVDGCGAEGIWVRPYAEVFTNADLTITGNTICDNSRAKQRASAGIRLEKVSGARLIGNRVGGGHSIGIEATTCDNLVVLGNDLRGNTAALRVAPQAVVRDNLGQTK